MARPIRDRPGCELGVAIDAIRAAEGWSLSDFAERAGMDRSAGPQVTKYRQGKHAPERERLEAWEARPELRPHMPAIWRAVALDGAKRAACQTADATSGVTIQADAIEKTADPKPPAARPRRNPGR